MRDAEGPSREGLSKVGRGYRFPLRMDARGKFIVIEGLDGAGTTTQSRRLVEWLRERGEEAEWTAEPTDGPIGRLIRDAIELRIKVDPRTLAALFAADRLEHAYGSGGIMEKLAAGIHVVSDRYALSSMAYQTLHAPLEWVAGINAQAPAPELTLFLRVDADTAWKRIHQRMTEGFMPDQPEDELFHAQESLKAIATKYDEAMRFDHPLTQALVLNGEANPDLVFSHITEAVTRILASGAETLA